MPLDYAAAVETLYRGPLDTFVTERKRLAGELKAAGDKQEAARLDKLGRPSISAWAVNQLWWHEHKAFERLFATAEQLKGGKQEARAAHREALAALRALAAARLVSSGHAAPESTMRRVTLTLSALAATGSFEPDPPGALAADRDPPGFESFGFGSSDADDDADDERDTSTETKHGTHDAHAKRREHAERERKRAAEERQRVEEERARKKAERERIRSELNTALSDAATLQRDAERLQHELRSVEAKLEKAQDKVEKLKKALATAGEAARN